MSFRICLILLGIPLAGCMHVSQPAPASPTILRAISDNHTLAREFDRSQIPGVPGPRISDRFPNVELTTHEGRKVRFVDDLIRDRVVVINFSYTQCDGTCPGTNAAIARLRKELTQEFGKSVVFLSLTLDPEVDTAPVLKNFADSWISKRKVDQPEWLFLTGSKEDLDAIRRTLGLYELDPELDADISQHAAILTFGNDRLNRWAALPSGTAADNLLDTIIRIAGTTQQQRYGRMSKSDALRPLVRDL
jgi:protein SCO1